MANKQLFKSGKGRLLPRAKAKNQEGAIAYAFGPKHALAQFAATGTLSATFYASAESQLEQLIGFADQVSPESGPAPESPVPARSGPAWRTCRTSRSPSPAPGR